MRTGIRAYAGFLFGTAALIALAAAFYFGRDSAITVKPESIAVEENAPADRSLAAVSPENLPAASPTSTETDPNISAHAAAALDLETGRELYAFHADERWPLASVTKLMTAAIALDRFSAGEVIVLAPADFAVGSTNLTASLQPGDQYRASDLLQVLLVPSSNEAGEAFARTYGRAAFLAEMNARAAAWGLSATHFDDPSGLSAANQSTPRELLVLVRRLYSTRPEIFAITQSPAAAVRELASGALEQFSSTNAFAGRGDFLGGKTGTTPEAGENLVSVFMVRGRPVAIAVFGATDRYAATRALLQLIP